MSWNATVICTQEFNPGKGATLGKKYKVKDGKIKYDNGMSSMNEFADIENLNNYNSAKYEIVPEKRRVRQGE